jgi:hypothetical protein
MDAFIGLIDFSEHNFSGSISVSKVSRFRRVFNNRILEGRGTSTHFGD